MPTCPVPRASRVGGDIQLRTTLAVPRVNNQPKPRPLAQPISDITASDTAPSRVPAFRHAATVPPHRQARAMATNPSASRPGNFTWEDIVIKTAPVITNATGTHRRNDAAVGSAVLTRSMSARSVPTRSMPTRSIPLSATSVPVSISPSISASLWMPATRCISSNGLAAPSHSALTSATPQRCASRGVAQTISPTPISTTTR